MEFSLRIRDGHFHQFTLDYRREKEMLNVFLQALWLGKKPKGLPKKLQPYTDSLAKLGIIIPKDKIPREVTPKVAPIKGISQFYPPSLKRLNISDLRKTHPAFCHKYAFLETGQSRPNTTWPGVPPPNTFPTLSQKVWVYDPDSKMWAYYDLSGPDFESVEGFKSGSSLERLSDEVVEFLAHAGVFEGVEQRTKFQLSEIDRARESVESEGFAVLRSVLTPAQLACLRSYFRNLEREGFLRIDLGQVIDGRLTLHNDPMLRFLHKQSGKLIRAVTGENVIPSYSFLSAYLERAELKKHIDRPQCEWNGSLLIDDNFKSSSWPIFLETEKGVRAINLELGEMVVYRGQKTPHWRPPLQPGHRQTLGLFHYVSIDFTGSLD